MTLPVMAMATRCINFYGLETEGEQLVCSWVNPPTYYLDRIPNLDTVRLPFSHQLVASEQGLAKLDNAISVITGRNLFVILDYHRTFNTHQSPGPDKEVTLDEFKCAWSVLLARYVDNTWVRGVDIFNEIQTSDKQYAQTVQADVLNHLEEAFPGRYHYYVGGVNWGKDVGGYDLKVQTPNYTLSVHEYPFFNENDDQMNARYNTNQRILVGEFGFEKNEYDEARRIVAFFKKKGIRDVCFWTIAHSYGTGGLWEDDCVTMIPEKLAIFNSIFDESLSVYSLRGSFP